MLFQLLRYIFFSLSRETLSESISKCFARTSLTVQWLERLTEVLVQKCKPTLCR